MSDILNKLAAVLEARRGADPQSSYVADLYAKGLDAILKKIGEEATEVVIAAKGEDRDQLVYEAADLVYHLLVVLSAAGVSLPEVWEELAARRR